MRGHGDFIRQGVFKAGRGSVSWLQKSNWRRSREEVYRCGSRGAGIGATRGLHCGVTCVGGPRAVGDAGRGVAGLDGAGTGEGKC